MLNQEAKNLMFTIATSDARVKHGITVEQVIEKINEKLSNIAQDTQIFISIGTNGQFGVPNLTLVDFRAPSETDPGLTYCIDEMIVNNNEESFWLEVADKINVVSVRNNNEFVDGEAKVLIDNAF